MKVIAILTTLLVIVVTVALGIYFFNIPKEKTVETVAANVDVEKNIEIEEPEEEAILIVFPTKEEINIEELEELTEEELEEQIIEEEPEQIKVDNGIPYYIQVNYGANVVNIYKKDENGNYTVPYKAMVCSVGTATPKHGIYKMDYKYRWLELFGNVYGQYATRIVGNILFHSVPYFKKDPATLEYLEYDKLGSDASLRMYQTYSRRCYVDIQ